ncbi:hypothetical protein HDU79_010040 [Rhizoclosmatium sp. JEL0117]|nr:hypothetical protein HDU79_010040 [Rhizoclosmatium sp. JEL0117]
MSSNNHSHPNTRRAPPRTSPVFASLLGGKSLPLGFQRVAPRVMIPPPSSTNNLALKLPLHSQHALRVLSSNNNSLNSASSPLPPAIPASQSNPLIAKPYLRNLLALNSAPGLTASKLRNPHILSQPTASADQLQRRKNILRATVRIQRWARANILNKSKKAVGYFKASPINTAAAVKIQRWFRKRLLKIRFARLVSTAKIVKILKSVEGVMSNLLMEGTSGCVVNASRIPGTAPSPLSHVFHQNSINSSISSNAGFMEMKDEEESLSMSGISGGSMDLDNFTNSPRAFSTTSGTKRVTSHSHFPTYFSPISSPRLVPTVVHLQSYITSLSNLIQEVSTVPSTSPRISKMKQSTILLIERYIDCVLEDPVSSSVAFDFAQHQLDALRITTTTSNNVETAISNHGGVSVEGTAQDETTSTDESNTTHSSMKGSSHLDKLIIIRRMEYALMQSIYGLGHGSSTSSEIITSRMEGFPSYSSANAAEDYILSDFYNDAAFAGIESPAGRQRSRESSTVASLFEVAIDTDSEAGMSEGLRKCCVKGLCRRNGVCRGEMNGKYGGSDENQAVDRYSESGSEIWEMI